MTTLYKLSFFLIVLVLAFGCSKDDLLFKEITYCKDARIQMANEQFSGWIGLRTSNDGKGQSIWGHAHVSQIGQDSLAMHVKSDSILIDTIMVFPSMCKLVDKVPCTVFFDVSGNEIGLYSYLNSKLVFSFYLGASKYNSYFDGIGK